MRRQITLTGMVAGIALFAFSGAADPLPPDASYRNLPALPFETVMQNDKAEKPEVMRRQRRVFEERYDLSNRPIPGVMMSGGRKPVQGGVRVKLPVGVTWDQLVRMTPEQIRERGLLPRGFLPLPHVKQATGGQVFPDEEIKEIRRQEDRNLRRFDVDFDIPDQFTPEFPPPIFISSRRNSRRPSFWPRTRNSAMSRTGNC